MHGGDGARRAGASASARGTGGPSRRAAASSRGWFSSPLRQRKQRRNPRLGVWHIAPPLLAKCPTCWRKGSQRCCNAAPRARRCQRRPPGAPSQTSSACMHARARAAAAWRAGHGCRGERLERIKKGMLVAAPVASRRAAGVLIGDSRQLEGAHARYMGTRVGSQGRREHAPSPAGTLLYPETPDWTPPPHAGAARRARPSPFLCVRGPGGACACARACACCGFNCGSGLLFNLFSSPSGPARPTKVPTRGDDFRWYARTCICCLLRKSFTGQIF
jgi:hypothetical protein